MNKMQELDQILNQLSKKALEGTNELTMKKAKDWYQLTQDRSMSAVEVAQTVSKEMDSIVLTVGLNFAKASILHYHQWLTQNFVLQPKE